MAYLSTKFDSRKKTTRFFFDDGRPASLTLSTKISRDDFYIISAMVEQAFTAGERAGSLERAQTIKPLLGVMRPR